MGAAVLAALSLALAGCASPVDHGGPDPSIRGQWELLSGKDSEGAIPLANQRISLTIAGDTDTTGRSTCSDYTARIYGTDSRLWVTATLPPDQDCGIQAQQDIEQRYIAALGEVRASTVTGGVMDLLGAGVDLKFQKALAVPLTLVVDRTWELATVAADSYYATSNPTPVTQTGASMRLTDRGKISGVTGCRRFSADYVENAGEIVVSRFRSVMRGADCSGNAQAGDTSLISVLLSGFTFISGNGQLTIASPRAEIALGFTGRE